MRMRWILTHIRPTSLSLAFALTVFGLTVREANAEPIRYVSSGLVNMENHTIQFQGTEGTFEQGTSANPFAFLVGRFVVDQSTSVSDLISHPAEFVITIQAPDLTVETGGGYTGLPWIRTDSSVWIRGHIGPGYEVPMGEASLFAFIDSVEYGSHHPISTGHIQKYTFPIPLGDLKSPRISPVMLAQDEFDPATHSFLSPPLMMETVPEPATAWVFVAGLGVLGLYQRKARRISRSAATPL